MDMEEFYLYRDSFEWTERPRILAEQVDIITKVDSDLVVAARNLCAAQQTYDALYEKMLKAKGIS